MNHVIDMSRLQRRKPSVPDFTLSRMWKQTTNRLGFQSWRFYDNAKYAYHRRQNQSVFVDVYEDNELYYIAFAVETKHEFDPLELEEPWRHRDNYEHHLGLVMHPKTKNGVAVTLDAVKHLAEMAYTAILVPYLVDPTMPKAMTVDLYMNEHKLEFRKGQQ